MLNTEELLYIKELLQEDQSETATTIKDKIEELTKDTGECIWEFYWYCGRDGSVSGTFRATKEEINKAIGMRVEFGEILGKHSDVCGILEERDLTLISDDPTIVNTYNTSGYNPLDYIYYKCSVCGCHYPNDEMYDTSDDNCICGYCESERKDAE